MQGEPWRELGEQIRLRRLELGLKQTDTPGVSASSWRNLEGGKQTSYKPFLLRNVERALGWGVGTIDRIVDGAEPEPIGGSVDDRLRELEDRFERIESALADLQRSVEDRSAGRVEGPGRRLHGTR